MPRIETASELSLSRLTKDYNEEEGLCASSASLGDQEVSVSALLAVSCIKAANMKEGSLLPPGCPSREEHTEVQELYGGHNMG